MVRKIIKINEEKCNGCGLCAEACHEAAIVIVDGKARLLRDDYCDGLGNCLPVCPTGAIVFEQREAEAFDEAAVKVNLTRKEKLKANQEHLPCGCPGVNARALEDSAEQVVTATNELRQWPVQIKLVPVTAPYFENAHLLVAADCAAYAHGAFHSMFMKNRICIIGCPKLDDADYSGKLSEIIARNNIKSVTVVRIEVPCCGGIEHAAVLALKNSGKFLPWRVVTLSTGGEVLEE